jgi:hypothetical protein
MTEWMDAVSKGADKPVSDEALSAMFDGIWGLLEARKFDVLDAVLQAAPVEQMPDIAMVSLLRYSYDGRDQLPNWNRLLFRCEQVMEKRFSEKLLIGLR